MENYTLQLHLIDTAESSASVIVGADECFQKYNCSGVIGDATTDHSELAQYVLQSYEV